jgi:hypothetical protein
MPQPLVCGQAHYYDCKVKFLALFSAFHLFDYTNFIHYNIRTTLDLNGWSYASVRVSTHLLFQLVESAHTILHIGICKLHLRISFSSMVNSDVRKNHSF